MADPSVPQLYRPSKPHPQDSFHPSTVMQFNPTAESLLLLIAIKHFSIVIVLQLPFLLRKGKKLAGSRRNTSSPRQP